MITDLVQIKTLGEKKREENERFRRHLKSHDHSDRILRRIAQGIEDQIDCTACANCCRGMHVPLSWRDVIRLVRFLGMSQKEFLEKYTMQSDDESQILLRSTSAGCVFLEGNLCSVYGGRPDVCRRFPHLVRGTGSIVSRMWKLINFAASCPIVYNSLEAFKEETRFRR